MGDGLGAQTLHHHARFLGVETGGLAPVESMRGAQAEKLIDPGRPAQRAVGQIAGPGADPRLSGDKIKTASAPTGTLAPRPVSRMMSIFCIIATGD
ncbi:hypothetical protein [Novosphingobium sp.]|uniref:hypothetical protein n=1 Tax=Novosphingobium sp. TaxID=1874826 RepID=UPI0031D1CDDD